VIKTRAMLVSFVCRLPSTTPACCSGRRASILLEELGLPYTAHPIDVTKDEQFAPDFLKVSPTTCKAAFPTRAGV
jgi:hypothetical protein